MKRKTFILFIAMIIVGLSISTAYASSGSGTLYSNGRVVTEPENEMQYSTLDEGISRGTILKSSVNVRKSANSKSEKVGELRKNQNVNVLESVSDKSGQTWYKVEIKSGKTGYVRGDLIRIDQSSSKENFEASDSTSNANAVQSSLDSSIQSDVLDTPNLNKVRWSAQEWYSNKDTRAYLVMGMIVECLESLPASALSVVLEAQDADSIYVANAAENEIDVYCFGEDARFVFIYAPRYEIGMYKVYKHENASKQGEEFMKQMLKEKKCSAYKRVTQSDIDALLGN